MSRSDAGREDVEGGFLLRIRTWRDALPFLTMIDALRPASSVIAWILMALPLMISAGISLGLTNLFGTWENWTVELESTERIQALPTAGIAVVLHQLFGPAIRFYSSTGAASSGVVLVALQCGLVLLWMVPATFVMRQSALALSGRLAMSTADCLHFVVRRIPAMLNVVVIPMLVIAGLFLLGYACHATAQIPVAGWWLSGALQILTLPLLIAGGVIGAGSIIAIPLAWASVAIEEDGSSFSAISRGYEYLLRRPLQLTLLLVASGAVLSVLYGLAWWMTGFLQQMLQRIETSASNVQRPTVYETVIEYFPNIVALTAFWCLVAWIYLLLRRSANGQEIEDVWEPRTGPVEPLPSLDLP